MSGGTGAARGKTSLLADFTLTALAGIALIVLSQFLFGSEFSSRAAARLAAPALGAFYGDGAQDRISVVLIDQPSLDRSKASWPVTYGYYAELLETIASYKPKAIFLDVLLIDERRDRTLPSLIATACAITEGGIPVLIGADVSPNALGLRRELAAARTTNGRPCLEPVGVVYDSDEFDHLAWTYPSRIRTHADGRTSVPTAAFALFDAMNDGGPARGPRDSAQHDIAVVWGTKSAPTARVEDPSDDLREPADDEAHPRCQKFDRATQWRLINLLRPHAPPACVFHETISALEMHGPDATTRAMLTAQLAGRAVVIGVSLAGTGDVIYTPLNGRVAGVYLHAMALDNLLAYDGAAKRNLDVREASSWTFILAMVVAAGGVTVFLAKFINTPIEHAIHRLRDARGAPGKQRVPNDWRRHILPLLGWKLLRFAAGTAAMVALICFGHAVLKVGVLGFIEVAVAGLTAHFAHASRFIRQPLKHGIARELYERDRSEDTAH